MALRIWFLALTMLLTGFAYAEVADATRLDTDPQTRLLFVGTDGTGPTPGDVPSGIRVFAIPTLPAAADARENAMATLLRATPVSTLVLNPGERSKATDQFFIVSDLTIEGQGEAATATIGQDSFALTELPDRLAAITDAFDPITRSVVFLRITDPGDVFPSLIEFVQNTVKHAQFDLLVANVQTGAARPECTVGDSTPDHYAIIGGIADRGPFGNADATSTRNEVERYLNRSLARRADRPAACPRAYSVIVKPDGRPDRVLASHSGGTTFRALEARFYHERFQARFLFESDDQAKLQAYLDHCEFCPEENALRQRLSAMRQHDETQRLEAEIWELIKDDAQTARIAIYLEDCAICQFRDPAQKRLDLLNAQSAVREDERQQFRSAAETRQLSALKAYADNCVACDFRAKADDLIAEIERDSAHKSEQATLDEALRTSNADQLRSYLKDCRLCTGRDDAEHAIADITKRFEAAGPCLALAGLPQQGGPRKLAQISIKKGRLVCGKALATYPGDPLLTVMMGRIEHAAGNFDAAGAAYQVGMRAGLPSAYGLAAYLLQNPPTGVAQDSVSADRLARKGAAKGDWLARELQIVMYSQGMISGRSEAEAFKIAAELAQEDNIAGQFFLGYFYLTGTGTDISQSNALRWLGQAYEGGYSHAAAYLAEIYENGAPEVASIERAADIYWSGLEAGDQTVMDRLTDQLRERKRPIIRLIQTRLRREGLYKGEIDGVPGPGTIRAIREIADRQNTG